MEKSYLYLLNNFLLFIYLGMLHLNLLFDLFLYLSPLLHFASHLNPLVVLA